MGVTFTDRLLCAILGHWWDKKRSTLYNVCIRCDHKEWI